MREQPSYLWILLFGGAIVACGSSTGSTDPSVGALCAVCSTAGDCAEGDCMLNQKTGQKFCGRDCAGSCPAGFSCISIKGGTTAQCVPNTGTCATSVAGAGGGTTAKGSYCEGNPRHVVGVATKPANSNPTDEEIRQYMLDAVNTVRAMTGLPPLRLDDCMNKIAEAAISDVAGGGSVHGYFTANCMNKAHNNGKSCECNWGQENYGMAAGSYYTWKDGINVPLCNMMDEPKGMGHRGNIESAEWTRLGVGFRLVSGGVQWVQEFGR